MVIPQQLKNPHFRFCLLGKWDSILKNKKGKKIYRGKAPFEKSWETKNNYKWFELKLRQHIENGFNFGCVCGYGNLRVLDIDDEKLANELLEKINTFTIKTGGGGCHFYFISDYNANHVLKDNLGELRSKNSQVVSAPCRHPNGNYYSVINDAEIKEISSDDLYKLIKPYLRDEQETTTIQKGKDTSGSGLEYRRCLAMIREGKTREEIYKEMLNYRKWASSRDDYRNLTYNKAYDYFLREQEKNIKKDITIDETSLKILQDPKLFENINKEFSKRIEGEEKSRKAIFLSLCYIWIKDSDVPINTLVSSESSAGKSYVCKNIIKIFPKELIEYRTKITPEAFTYWHTNDEGWNWDGKICYLEDISQAILDAPTFKVMCSEGSMATIVIKQKAVDLEIKGKPVMLVTTASTNPKAEVINRFQIVSMDESKEQTEAIVFRIAKDKDLEQYDKNMINALRFLKRIKVKINYGEKIAQFLRENYNFKSLRLRRDFSRLLDLIKCSASLHQYQREKDTEGNILANEEDYRIARECINYIQTHTFRGLTHKLKKAYDCCKKLKEFTAKEIHAGYPFCSQKMWYNYLDDLSERNLLTAELRTVEGVKQQVTYYKIEEGVVFTLPEFNILPQNITNVTLVSKVSKDTIVSKDKEQLKQLKQFTSFSPTNFDKTPIKPSELGKK